MTKTTLWAQVAALLEEGKAPKIQVQPEAEIKGTKRSRGRPAKRDPENPFLHYRTPRKGKAQPRCLACKKRLRVQDHLTCSEECQKLAVEWHQKQLDELTSRRSVA